MSPIGDLIPLSKNSYRHRLYLNDR